MGEKTVDPVMTSSSSALELENKYAPPDDGRNIQPAIGSAARVPGNAIRWLCYSGGAHWFHYIWEEADMQIGGLHIHLSCTTVNPLLRDDAHVASAPQLAQEKI